MKLLKVPAWRDNRGQDLIEYALMAGFVAVGAAAALPSIAPAINVIFSKILVSLSSAATQGS